MESNQTFLCQYARDNALPLPGRLPNYKNSQVQHVLLLPSDKSCADIHQLYEKVASELLYRNVSLRTFQRVWHELCPHITITKPLTDLCGTCQMYGGKISNSGCLSEEEKTKLLEDYNGHVHSAKLQRDYYRDQVNKSKENFLTYSAEITGNI